MGESSFCSALGYTMKAPGLAHSVLSHPRSDDRSQISFNAGWTKLSQGIMRSMFSLNIEPAMPENVLAIKGFAGLCPVFPGGSKKAVGCEN